MKNLGELILTDFDAARPILEAWARGEPLQWYYGRNDWTDWKSRSALVLGNTYRIPPRPHTVDWSQVGERIMAFETSAQAHYAISEHGGMIPADYWTSFRPGTDGGRIERPKEVK